MQQIATLAPFVCSAALIIAIALMLLLAIRSQRPR